jgi:hypothetical protein
MPEKINQIFSLGSRAYELIEVDGPICRGNRTFPAQFDHDAGVLRISKTVPIEQRAWVVAVAVADACFLMWNPVPVIWPIGWTSDPPTGLPGDRRASPPRGPDPADDPPHR